jgi:acyl-CoA synthetase (AMP-forming)/AMP-acid ligase II
MVGGMFDTGDLGELHEGRLHVIGRVGSLIISGGHNVSPERVESVLDAHPLIEQSLVYGRSDQTWGELICADVVTRGHVSDDELMSFCRQRLAAWETPRVLNRVESIPLTKTGKPDRSQVKHR